MTLTHVSLLFLVQTGFGSLLTFVVNDRDALGPKYFKFSGWVLLGLFGLAGTLIAPTAAADDATRVQLACAAGVGLAALGSVAFASVSGWDQAWLERACLGLALIGGATAVVLGPMIAGPAPTLPPVEQALVVASSITSALVLGFVTWGMTLGHWYLVSKDLDISHLARLVRPLPWMLLGKAVVSGLALWLMWDRFLGPGVSDTHELMARSPERVLDVFNIWARIPVGLLAPGVMAWMTLVTVRMRKTQPATGILYAMCCTVYLGELIGKMVEGSTGVPL